MRSNRREFLRLASLGLAGAGLRLPVWAEDKRGEPLAGQTPGRLPGGDEFRPIPGVENDFFTALHDQHAPFQSLMHGFKGHGTPPSKGDECRKYGRARDIYGREVEQCCNSPAHPANSSAHAAAATMLGLLRKGPEGKRGQELVNHLYRTHPPDILGGTSPDQMTRMLFDNGVSVWSAGASSEGFPGIYTTIQDFLRWGYPTILQLDMGPLTDYKWRGQHWTVAYALDLHYCYLTNWDYRVMCNSWAAVFEAWSIPRCTDWAYWAVAAWNAPD